MRMHSRYLIVIFLGIPFTLMYNYLSSILRSVGDSQNTFSVSGFFSRIQYFSGFVLHYSFTLGMYGGSYCNCNGAGCQCGILCLLFIVRKKCRFYGWKRKIGIMQRKTSGRRTFKNGHCRQDSSFPSRPIGSMVMQSANNGLGSICVSGFTAGMRIKQFTMCPV